MSNTYNESVGTVTDGDTTSHDTSKDGEINILSAECRWQGVNTTSSTTKTDVKRSFRDLSADSSGSWEGTVEWPFLDEFETFLEHKISLNPEKSDVEYWLWKDENDTTNDKSTADYHEVVSAGTNEYYVETNITENLEGTVGYAIAEWTDGVTLEDCSLGTHTKYEYEEHTTYNTKDPSVSGDVSASYTGTLSDGEWSPWVTLSGLTESTNHNFNHAISGSNKAKYEFSYVWEYTYPTALSEERFSINGTTYITALVDTDDPALDYSVYRIKHPTEGIVAYDLVDPSDPNALPRYIYHPTHGKLAHREKQ